MHDVLTSLRRGMARIVLLLVIGAAFLLLAHAPELLDARGGAWPALVPMFLPAGKVFLGLAAGDLALRILQPRVDPQAIARAAVGLGMAGPSLAPALVYLARNFLAAVILYLVVASVQAAQPPAAAVPLLPVLQAEQRAWWPAHPMPSALGAQVEQETCPSLTHRKCWNPRAELRTHREQGVGLAQLTRTWRKDGTQRFDALSELVAAHPEQLRELSWDNRFDPRLQLRALVLKDRQDFRLVRGAATWFEQLAMALAAYNGGQGDLAKDRRICAATVGCDPGRWFGHVERHSVKPRTREKGYGMSFYAINREYPHNILAVRRVRYQVLDA